MKQDTDGDGKNDDQERDGWAIATGKDSPHLQDRPHPGKDTDGDGKTRLQSPDGGPVTDENPVEADEGNRRPDSRAAAAPAASPTRRWGY